MVHPTPTPRFHVQRTGAELRDGYPYFHHHDSISALWSMKWRRNCAAGLYPFYDGDVSDFDPIFAALAADYDDDPAVLGRPHEYGAAFRPVAERLRVDADHAASDGDTILARRLYLRAAAVCRISRFPVIRSTHGQWAWAFGKAA